MPSAYSGLRRQRIRIAPVWRSGSRDVIDERVRQEGTTETHRGQQWAQCQTVRCGPAPYAAVVATQSPPYGVTRPPPNSTTGSMLGLREDEHEHSLSFSENFSASVRFVEGYISTRADKWSIASSSLCSAREAQLRCVDNYRSAIKRR